MEKIDYNDFINILSIHRDWVYSSYQRGFRAKFVNYNFAGWDFSKMNLSLAHFKNCCFGGTNLKKVNFCFSSLENCNFSDSCLIYTSFYNANLTDAKFRGATLLNTDFLNANTIGARFDENGLSYLKRPNVHLLTHTNPEFNKKMRLY